MTFHESGQLSGAPLGPAARAALDYPVVRMRSPSRPNSLDCAAWIGLTIYGTKRPSIGNLPSRPMILSLKNEMLELASVCEEVASNIEDQLTGG